jgi:hypothetical protein
MIGNPGNVKCLVVNSEGNKVLCAEALIPLNHGKNRRPIQSSLCWITNINKLSLLVFYIVNQGLEPERKHDRLSYSAAILLPIQLRAPAH